MPVRLSFIFCGKFIQIVTLIDIAQTILKNIPALGKLFLTTVLRCKTFRIFLSNVAIKTLQIYVHMLFQCGKRMIGSSITCLTILIIYGISILPQNLYAQRMMNIQLISVFR